MKLQKTTADRFADAAVKLIGVSFRLHGREPTRGLDCVGLVHFCLSSIGWPALAPEGYRLRNADPTRWFKFAKLSGFIDVNEAPVRGDIVMIDPGPGQQHLVIVDTGLTGIHSHAGLRRVVRQPMTFPSTPLAHWRLP